MHRWKRSLVSSYSSKRWAQQISCNSGSSLRLNCWILPFVLLIFDRWFLLLVSRRKRVSAPENVLIVGLFKVVYAWIPSIRCRDVVNLVVSVFWPSDLPKRSAPNLSPIHWTLIDVHPIHYPMYHFYCSGPRCSAYLKSTLRPAWAGEWRRRTQWQCWRMSLPWRASRRSCCSTTSTLTKMDSSACGSSSISMTLSVWGEGTNLHNMCGTDYNTTHSAASTYVQIADRITYCLWFAKLLFDLLSIWNNNVYCL